MKLSMEYKKKGGCHLFKHLCVMFLSFYSLVSIVTKLYDFKTCESNWRPKFTKYWTSAHPFSITSIILDNYGLLFRLIIIFVANKTKNR